MMPSPSASIRSQPFYGQMSMFYFFAEPIPKPEDIMSLYLLGVEYTPVIDAEYVTSFFF